MKVYEIDVTPVLHAIERARVRMLELPHRTPQEAVEFARVVIAEMGKIIDATDAYNTQAQFAETQARRKREQEAEEFHSPKPGTVN